MSIRVVLPAPFGPKRPRISSSRIVIENSFTASSVPNLLPALSKPIKTIFHRGRMKFASQFERTPEISIFQQLPRRAGQKRDSQALGLGTSIERFRAPNWEKNNLAEGITCSRRHSTVGGSSSPYSPASKAQSVQSRSGALRVARRQLVCLFQRFRRCGVELRRAERLLPTSPYPGSSEPHFAPGSR